MKGLSGQNKTAIIHEFDYLHERIARLEKRHEADEKRHEADEKRHEADEKRHADEIATLKTMINGVADIFAEHITKCSTDQEKIVEIQQSLANISNTISSSNAEAVEPSLHVEPSLLSVTPGSQVFLEYFSLLAVCIFLY